MNGYVCFYRGRKIEVTADTQLQARDKAAAILKAKKAYEVTCVLAEKDDKPVVHDGAELP